VIEEGKYRLAEEFGSEQSTYFSILACIASGKTSRSDIESVLEVSVGPYLQRLESEFDIIQRIQPVLSTPKSRQVKYRIQDAFLSFGFVLFTVTAVQLRSATSGILETKREHTFKSVYFSVNIQ